MHGLAYEHLLRTDSPVLMATPHTGSIVPAELLEYPAWVSVNGRLADPAGVQLQRAAKSNAVSCISAVYHPCAIDLNVASDVGQLPKSLVYGSLCRTQTSSGEALYPPGSEPTEAEVGRRVSAYWRPFHTALIAELLRLRRMHDNVLLLVSHASAWLSPYRDSPAVSDCNVGTNGGRSCDRRLVSALTRTVEAHRRSWVVNGNIADAFAAQRYGLPASGIHVIEVEIAARWRAELNSTDGSRMRREDPAMGSLIANLQDAMSSLPRADCLSDAAFVSPEEAGQ
ncbi:N-formylglutamate amidohydrolase [Paraburkholderia diazotrophica]|uniref:N-formylglutamate amidohydrolase n=1 Tax=Paraburkholderia diazotrophica TaxID=667676 RepID=A0A1H6YIW5_9BURK|nr:N-formylglutamate amidohydrolase [Paraburkholderia diazotrophica]SEJ39764.1 N-formylglutamate amidohydrolase [Paraburkholderia diazotrophica]